jgi:hypothetical protein
VELTNIGNPSPYDLYLWNGSSFVFDTTLLIRRSRQIRFLTLRAAG